MSKLYGTFNPVFSNKPFSLLSTQKQLPKTRLSSPILNDELILKSVPSLKFSGVQQEKVQKLSDYIESYNPDEVERFFQNITTHEEKQSYANSIINLTQKTGSKVLKERVYCLTYALLQLNRAIERHEIENKEKGEKIRDILIGQGADLSKVAEGFQGHFLNYVAESYYYGGRKALFSNNLPEIFDWVLSNTESTKRSSVLFDQFPWDLTKDKPSVFQFVDRMQDDELPSVKGVFSILLKHERGGVENKIRSTSDTFFNDLCRRANRGKINKSITHPNDSSFKGYPLELLIRTLGNNAFLKNSDLKDLKHELMGKYLNKLDEMGADPNLGRPGGLPSELAAAEGDFETIRQLRRFQTAFTKDTIEKTIKALQTKKDQCNASEKKMYNKFIDAFRRGDDAQMLAAQNPPEKSMEQLEKERLKRQRKKEKSKDKKSENKKLEKAVKFWQTIREIMVSQHKRNPLTILSKEQVLENELREKELIEKQEKSFALASNWWKATSDLLRVQNRKMLALFHQIPLTVPYPKTWQQVNNELKQNLRPLAILSKEHHVEREAVNEKLKLFESEESDSRVKAYIQNFKSRLETRMKHPHFSEYFKQLESFIQLKKKVKSQVAEEYLNTIIRQFDNRIKDERFVKAIPYLNNLLSLEINSLHESIHEKVKFAIQNFDNHVSNNNINYIADTVNRLGKSCYSASNRFLSILEKDANGALKSELKELISTLPKKIMDPDLDLPKVVNEFSARLKTNN